MKTRSFQVRLLLWTYIAAPAKVRMAPNIYNYIDILKGEGVSEKKWTSCISGDGCGYSPGGS